VVLNTTSAVSNLNFPPSITGLDVAVNAAGMATLTALVSDESPSTLTYQWNIGGVNIGTTNPITVSQPASGTLVTVTVTDDKGTTNSYSMSWGG
jgi:hypothetical protein